MLIVQVIVLLWSIGLLAASFAWPLASASIWIGSMWLLFIIVWCQDFFGRPRERRGPFSVRPLFSSASYAVLSHPNGDIKLDVSQVDETIRKYHLWLRSNLGCLAYCAFLASFDLALILWVPRLLWGRFWVLSVAAILYDFISGPLRARLNPGSVYSGPAKKGNVTAIKELTLIEMAQKRLADRKDEETRSGSLVR